MSEENKALVRRYYEELFNKGDLSVADELIAPPRENVRRSENAAN